MKHQLAAVSILLLGTTSIALGATLHSMTKQEVASGLMNKTVSTIPLSYVNNHLILNSVTVYADATGQLQGHLAQVPRRGPQNDQGSWTISDDGQFCTVWQHWNKAKTLCSYLYDANNSIIFVGTNGSFNTLILKQQIKPGNSLRAR